MIDAGELVDEVDLIRMVESDNGRGGKSRSESTLAAGVWAKVTPDTGDERLQKDANVATQSYKVVLRYRADLLIKDRIKWTPYDGSQITLEVSAIRLADREMVIVSAEGIPA